MTPDELRDVLDRYCASHGQTDGEAFFFTDIAGQIAGLKHTITWLQNELQRLRAVRALPPDRAGILDEATKTLQP